MAVLSLNNISHSFGDFDLFVGISASIPHGGKVGLVGPNGIGKTTLLRIIAGESRPSDGELHMARGTSFGYLEQEAGDAFTSMEHSVWQEMLTVFDDLRRMEAQLSDLEQRLAEDASLLDSYGDLQQQFELAGGYDYELRIQQTLTGLGFKDGQWEMPLQQLSGGQKTRALLARLLLEKPDLLILDEPTNHLDVEAIAWLENTLHLWEGSILIVSHDRYFLDRSVNTIWEMSRVGVEVYRGNYSHYLQQRQMRWEHQQQVFDAEYERLSKEMDFIKRNFVRASTHDRAMGRLRLLSRDIVAIQQAGVMALKNTKWLQLGIGKVKPFGLQEAEQALKSLQRPSNRPPKLNMYMRRPTRSGDIVLRSKHLEIGYPGNSLFRTNQDIYLTRGEIVGMIGPNGTGKSTFLKVLLGQLQPLRGELMLGASLELGYFAQVHEMLNEANPVLEEFQRHHPMPISQARNILGSYLFRNDDVYKTVGVLSGGERARLALAILSLEGANFLLLDEPTNHLDIPTQEILQDTLENFGGTVILVTHDRYLVDRLATQIWALKDGVLDIFKGTYQEYLAAQGAGEVDAAASGEVAPPPENAAANGRSQLSKNEQRRREAQASELEERIHKLEAQLAQTMRELQKASEAQDFSEIQRLGDAYHEQEAALEAMMEEWAALEW